MRCLVLLAFLLPMAVAQAAADYRIETVAEGLEHPWCLAFLPDGAMLVTERAGRLRMIREGQLLPQAITGVPPAYVRGQGGLFDVLPDPDFASNRRLYLSLAHGDAKGNATRIVSARLEGLALRDVKVIFTASPLKTGGAHYGARMAWGADGMLYMGIGDGYNWREQAQSLSDHFGAVVRISPDGSVPADNPFIGRPGLRPEIYSYGHRNPQGLAFDAVSGRLWLHEHGPKGGDELNLLKPGANYGWPKATYGMDYTGAVISPYTELPGVEPPLAVWVPSIAPAGLSVYRGGEFPNWQGNLFVAALKERSLRRLVIKQGQVVEQQVLLRELDERLRDVRSGPDGALYLLTDAADGRVLRLRRARP